MRYLILVFSLLISSPSLSETRTYTDGQGIRVYHTLFNSLMMEPEAANALGLTRAGDVASLTVALTKPQGDNRFSLGRPGLLRAWSKNILGQEEELSFVTVEEGDVVYYIAQIDHTNNETLRIKILAGFDDGSRAEAIFHQQMYVEND